MQVGHVGQLVFVWSVMEIFGVEFVGRTCLREHSYAANARALDVEGARNEELRSSGCP